MRAAEQYFPMMLFIILYKVVLTSGAPNEKNRKNASNAVFSFLISFYGLLKGYLRELTQFDLFGCGI